MAISAQDKIMYVANKLGLSTLKDMQGSTGAIYDSDPTGSGILFANAKNHTTPLQTNLSDNQFEVNSALLIESIAFYSIANGFPENLIDVAIGRGDVIVFDLIIGNKVVMKDTPIFMAGSPQTFSQSNTYFDGQANSNLPKHQLFLEGAGILIPPQVEFSINYSIYTVATGAKLPAGAYENTACYLFGTRVLLNFNTTI